MIIHTDDTNIIIIGSIYGCKSFEIFDIRENKWSDYLINGNTFDNLFGIQIDVNNEYSRLLFPQQ